MKKDKLTIDSDNYLFKELMKLSFQDINELLEEFVDVIGEDKVELANKLGYKVMDSMLDSLIETVDKDERINNGVIACMWLFVAISSGLCFIGECERAHAYREIQKLDMDFLEEEPHDAD